MPNNEILKIISNETKDSIDQMSIVTPSVYASLFSKYATKHDIKIENEDKLSTELIQRECSALTDLQTKTSKNAQNLSDTTTKAITAIQDKDETTLNEVLQETKALRQEIEKLKESVYKDELTNVYNRKWLHDNYLVENSGVFKEDGVLAILDLNFFKLVNDTHGHIIGDKVLIFIANQLQKTRYDTVRYGGDEFILMIPKNVDEGRALKILNSIREDVISKKLKAHNSMFRTSFSIGLCSYSSGDELSKTIEIADKNMYEDKLEIKKRIPGIEI